MAVLYTSVRPEFCHKNILQIFSVRSGNIKIVSFLDVRGAF